MKLEKFLDLCMHVTCAVAWIWLTWRVVFELSK